MQRKNKTSPSDEIPEPTSTALSERFLNSHAASPPFLSFCTFRFIFLSILVPRSFRYNNSDPP